MDRIIALLMLIGIVSTDCLAVVSLKLKDLPVGALVILTQDSHDSWPAWGLEHKLAFVSPKSGRNEIYAIDLDALEFFQAKESIYVASNLKTKEPWKHYQPLTRNLAKGFVAESPFWSQDGKEISFNRYRCEGKSGCDQFSLVSVNRGTGRETDLLPVETELAAWLDAQHLLFVSKKEGSVLSSLDMQTRKISPIYKDTVKIEGLAVHEGRILIANHESIKSIDPKTNKVLNVISAKFNGTRLVPSGSSFIYTAGGPKVISYSIPDKKEVELFGEGNYEPAMSKDGAYLAVISEAYSGLILRKMK